MVSVIRMFQSAIRLSISSIAGGDRLGRGEHVVLGAALPGERRAEDEADLDLDPRL